MMCCTKCGTESRTGRKFCANCGSALAIRCPKCTAENDPLSKFWEDCGAELTVAPPDARVDRLPQPQGEIHVAATVNDNGGDELAGEHKTVTALFADIKRRPLFEPHYHVGKAARRRTGPVDFVQPAEMCARVFCRITRAFSSLGVRWNRINISLAQWPEGLAPLSTSAVSRALFSHDSAWPLLLPTSGSRERRSPSRPAAGWGNPRPEMLRPPASNVLGAQNSQGGAVS
jgi:hypothetical protein